MNILVLDGEWLGHRHAPQFGKAAAAIEPALDDTIASPDSRTRDMGSSHGTMAFTDAVIEKLAR
jgi:isocitrate/isopropylmalate dehydrogenase